MYFNNPDSAYESGINLVRRLRMYISVFDDFIGSCYG